MNQNLLNSSGFFLDNYYNYSNGLQQQTDVTQTNNQAHYNNLDSSYNYTDPFSMTNNNISPVNNALSTISSTSQDFSNALQYDNRNANGPPYSVNPPNATFNSSPTQIIHKFEIPGFEIEMIIRPKSNPIMNLSNLDTQYQPQVDKSHPSMNSYYISSVDGTSTSGSSATFVNTMDTMNTMNIDNSQFQFQQQNSLGFNNFHG